MASGLSIFVKALSGQFDKAMEEATADLKAASMGAAQRAAEIVKQEGRSDIASAGFGPKWQNALKVVVYPKGGKQSTHPTIQAYHKIGYSQIFEEGGSIAGRPLLWLPLPSAPKTIGRNRTTPSLYVKRVGPLFPIYRTGHRPLLAARLDTGRRGAHGGRERKMVPLFVGISTVTLRDRFSIREIAEKAADRLPELFAQAFNRS